MAPFWPIPFADFWLRHCYLYIPLKGRVPPFLHKVVLRRANQPHNSHEDRFSMLWPSRTQSPPKSQITMVKVSGKHIWCHQICLPDTLTIVIWLLGGDCVRLGQSIEKRSSWELWGWFALLKTTLCKKGGTLPFELNSEHSIPTRGVATDFLVGGRIVGRVANLPQNTLKIGKKNTGKHRTDTPLRSRIWGVDPPGFQKCGGQDPLDPPPPVGNAPDPYSHSSVHTTGRRTDRRPERRCYTVRHCGNLTSQRYRPAVASGECLPVCMCVRHRPGWCEHWAAYAIMTKPTHQCIFYKKWSADVIESKLLRNTMSVSPSVVCLYLFP